MLSFRTLLILAIAWIASVSAAFAQSGDPEEAAIRAALDNYLQGHATGDGAFHARVFHPQARLFWIRDDTLNTRTSADYIAGTSGQPAEDEDQRRRGTTMVDRTGDAAVAKIVLDYPNALITDYMSLLKIDGSWRIVNKVFHVQPKATAASR